MGEVNDWLARFRGSVARPVSSLAAGTFLAQLAPVLVAPLLTRLYSPDAYGALAWAVSIVSVTSLIATGTYDQAVNLPAERTTAAALVHGLIVAGAATALLLAAVSLIERAGQTAAAPRLWFVPVATGASVAFNALSMWCVREGYFGTLALGRVSLALAGVATTLALGYAGWTEAGLMAGNLVGLGAGIVVLGAGAARQGLPPWPAAGFREMWQAAQTYRRFPLLFLPSSLLNAVTNQLPLWFLQRLFGSGVVGQYALMSRVLSVPVTLASSSAGEVFKQQAAAEFRTTGQCATAWRAFAPSLIGLAIPIGVALLLAGPTLFAWVFGEPWREAGHYARVLAVFFTLRFFVSPLSYLLIVAQRQRLDLILQGGCLAAALAGWWAGAISASATTALGVFGALYAAVYVAYFVVTRRLAFAPSRAAA